MGPGTASSGFPWFLGWAAGWWIALRYSEPLALRLGACRELLANHPDLLRLACFIFLLVVVVFLASLVGWLLSRMVRMAKMGPMDRLMGAGLGMSSIVLVCAAAIPILAAWPPDGGWLMSESVIAPTPWPGETTSRCLHPIRGSRCRGLAGDVHNPASLT